MWALTKGILIGYLGLSRPDHLNLGWYITLLLVHVHVYVLYMYMPIYSYIGPCNNTRIILGINHTYLVVLACGF